MKRPKELIIEKKITFLFIVYITFIDDLSNHSLFFINPFIELTKIKMLNFFK